MNVQPCGCCEPAAASTPVQVDNRPGLSAIAYRIGTYSSFREAMLQAIATTPELASLATRLSDDPAITVFELWATVADVLTFYQERIANEAFWKTAQQRDSILRLARLLDYQLRPGVAATTLLAFTLEKNARVKVPVGLRVQSVPGQDEKPQKFETIETLAADDRLNALRLVSSPIGINPLGKGSTGAFVAPGAEALAAAVALGPADRVIVFNAGTTDAIEELKVQDIRISHDRIWLEWSAPIQHISWHLTSEMRRFNRTFRIFGYNAPFEYMQPASNNQVAGGIEWKFVAEAVPDYYAYPVDPADASFLALDVRHEGVAAGSQVLIADAGGGNQLVTVLAVEQFQAALGPAQDTVTRLQVTPPLSPIADRRQVTVYELTGPRIQLWGLAYADKVETSSAYVPGRMRNDDTIEIGRTIAQKSFQPGVTISLKDIELGRRLLFTDGRHDPVAAVLTGISIVSNEPHVAPTPADPMTSFELGLSPEKAEIITGLVSTVLDPFPEFAQSTPKVAITIGSIGPVTAILAATPTNLTEAASQLQGAIASADPAFAGARVLPLTSENRLLILPGTASARVSIARTALDTTSARELGLDSEHAHPIRVLQSAVLTPFPVLTSPAPQISIAMGPIGPRVIELAAPVADLQTAAAQLQDRLNNAGDLSPAFLKARVASVDDRLLILPGLVGADVEEYLAFALEPDIVGMFDSGSAVLLGNVARASHGETIKQEVVGDGDAAAKFQRLALKKKPLTYVPDAAGLKSSLRVLVNRVLWAEVPTLFGQPAVAQVHTTRTADDGTVSVGFGNGVMGAAAFSGRGNIIATYRHGAGLAGRVRSGTLTSLIDRPVGLKSVTNPRPAVGGADPQAIENARKNAPPTVRTFGRAVSLLDFEDLAAASGEVAKASATWLWIGDGSAVHLTIAGQAAAQFTPDALARIHAALGARSDPNHIFLLDNFSRIPIVVSARIEVAQTHMAADVERAAYDALVQSLAFDALAFGRPIHVSDLYAVLQGVPGVVWVRIDRLQFKDQSPAFLAARGATGDPVQEHLRMYPARFTSGPPAGVLTAEQAWIEAPTQDVVLLTSGGLPV